MKSSYQRNSSSHWNQEEGCNPNELAEGEGHVYVEDEKKMERAFDSSMITINELTKSTTFTVSEPFDVMLKDKDKI